MIASVAEKILKGLSGGKVAAKNTDEGRKKVTVLPYMHKISHGLKKIAEKRGTKVVFSAPLKLKGLCKKVNSEKEKPSSNSCRIRHANRYVDCVDNVVYKIPLTCERSYFGQTGRCLNIRLREHRYATEMLQSPGHLAAHCARCGCKPMFSDTKVLEHSKSKKGREIMEAYFMQKNYQSTYVSSPSVVLGNPACNFIDNHHVNTHASS